MGKHPINLVLRFLLEMIALFAIGYWGYKQSNGIFKYILAIGIPIIFATIWGVFNVPNDPSRSGNAPVVVSGIVRLFIEICFFAFAVWAIHKTGQNKFSIIFFFVIVFHYALSYDRINWLFKH